MYHFYLLSSETHVLTDVIHMWSLVSHDTIPYRWSISRVLRPPYT